MACSGALSCLSGHGGHDRLQTRAARAARHAASPRGTVQRGRDGDARTGIRALLGELDARRVAVDGMTITRLHGTLTLGNGLAVRYSSGWLIWAVGRPSCQQRPLHTLHSAHDPAGAARRLARLAGSRDTD